MAAIDDLLADLCEGRRAPFDRELEGWLRGSRRFQAFAAEHRSKIRAKLKRARDAEGLRDARAELEAAALLLTEPGFALEYERYAASGERGPDFSVTYKGHTLFNVEVRRVRSLDSAESNAEAEMGKLLAVLCDKVGQMPPGVLNVLWLTATGGVRESSLVAAAQALRELAERKADAFFAPRGFAAASDFLRQYQRLGAVVLPQPAAPVWLNPLARHKAPPDIVRALHRAASATPRVTRL